ncbi:Ldh family oxidoreductase [Acidianus ambivalens]|uniref:Ldh family oxidoreductase n=1 Tax=Acidianus ambivalens TaxID=2283 RepID=A0A650CWK2_ACIAM|nr:Ldh family oxidoreductase [Acidianus ambivalens]MQL54348.1 hypothetical protein [Acidianus ambivalens]QGR22173.1 hypothetical protein D1866_09410 [Acidianus ambivalens]
MKVDVEEAKELVYKIFSKVTYAEYAKYLSEELVEAEIEGHSDHGLQLIPYYIKLANGEEVDIGGQKIPPINPKGKVEISGENLITVNGNMTFGQVVLRKLVNYLLEKNLDYYVVIGKNISHLGRLSTFTRGLSKGNYASLIMARSPPLISLKGMKGRILGNNPISFGFPGIIIDTALSVTSFGKALEKYIKGEKLDSNVIVNKEGELSDNPKDLLEGGALLPIGDYKGFNIALGIELFTTMFSDEEDVNPFIALVLRANENFKNVLLRLPSNYYLLNKESKLKNIKDLEIPDNLWKTLVNLAQ